MKNTRQLLSIRELDPSDIVGLLDTATEMRRRVLANEALPATVRRTIGLLFFEGSTRTRVSFEQACNYLGYKATNFSDKGSSMSKGETFKDTILTMRYERLEGLVVRHPASGSANLAGSFFGGAVVNAGDGRHEHPTQALGDALTLLQRKGRIEGLEIAIVGDVLHSRVARSNAWLLSKLGANIRLVGPKTLMPSNMSHFPGQVYYDLLSGIADCDAIMCLRLQRERIEGGRLGTAGEYRRRYQINRETLRFAKPDCLIMHPGPINRGIELDDLAADGASSAIRDQVENGIFTRMAALDWVFGGEMAAELKPKASVCAVAKVKPKPKPKAKAKAAPGGKKK